MTFFRILIALFIFTHFAHGQIDSARYSLTYALSRTAVTNNAGGGFEGALASSIFAHYEMATKKKWRPTLGVGYQQSHVIFRDYSGMQAYKDEERHYYLNYLDLLTGIKFSFGSVYVHPEIGVSYNPTIRTKSYLVDPDMDRVNGIYYNDKISKPFDPYLASAMAVGYEFKASSFALLVALRGYLAFNPGFFNTYGIGLMVGLKI